MALTSGLKRALGWPTAAAVVIANMIGAGIFTTSGFIARDVGSAVAMMALWMAGGIVALIGAMAYAELGAAMPQAGGEYVYLREAYGRAVAYLSGWTSFFAGFSGAIAAALLAFAGYLGALVPALAHLDPRVIALAVLAALTAIHIAGADFGGGAQLVLTASTVLVIGALLVLGFGFGRGSAANFISSAPARGHAAVSLIFVLYAYSGWNAAAYLGGEVRDPERGLPRALIAATAAVSAIYLALNALYVWAMPISAMSGVLEVGQRAAAAMFGARAAAAVTAIIALAILSSASAMMMAGPRIYFAMARDGVFPAFLAGTPGARGPAAAIAAQAAWVAVLTAVFGVFDRIVIYTGFAITLFSAATVAAVVVLRTRDGDDARRPFRMPGYPLLNAVYVAVSGWIAVYTVLTRPKEAFFGIATVVAGLPLYRFFAAGAARSPHRARLEAR